MVRSHPRKFCSIRRQQVQLRLLKKTPLPFLDPECLEREATDLRAVQRASMIARGSQHALNLVVFALLQNDLELILATVDARHRREWSRLIVQLDAGQ